MITEGSGVIGSVVYRPAPCLIPFGLVTNALSTTRVLVSVSWTGGPDRNGPFQMPPPCAVALGARAVPVFRWTSTPSRASRLLLKTPAPMVSAEPSGLRATAEFPLIRVFRTVTCRGFR